MSRQAKPGRNDPCVCGSGKKFKHCCEHKTATSRRSRVLLAVVAAAVIGGVAATVWRYSESSSMGPGAGLVWSPEHGHYH